MACYAGIGSRQTPLEVRREMTALARELATYGWVLRSGGAVGADTAFEAGAGLRKEIFTAANVCARAMALAEEFHPAWHLCSPYARRLHARNGYQILGANLDSPADMVVCWTADGGATGGTGQALRVAAHFGVPVFNMYDPSAAHRARAHVMGLIYV